jgi:hypothetical protein
MHTLLNRLADELAALVVALLAGMLHTTTGGDKRQ